jgi:hypothetical protein
MRCVNFVNCRTSVVIDVTNRLALITTSNHPISVATENSTGSGAQGYVNGNQNIEVEPPLQPRLIA